jgi:signal peptidase II
VKIRSGSGLDAAIMERASASDIGRRLLPLAVAAPVVALDRITKDAVVGAIGPGAVDHRIELLGRGLALEYAENRGAAFGLFGAQSPLLPLAAIAIVLAIGLAYLRLPRPPLIVALAAGLALGGAIGNLIDRLRFGHVVDFIAVGPWPNFNVADSALTIGVVSFVIWSIWRGGADRAAGAASREAAVSEGSGAR